MTLKALLVRTLSDLQWVVLTLCAAQQMAMTISSKLWGMPLALEQAGSLLPYGLVSMHDYNKQFRLRYQDKTLKTPMKNYLGSYERVVQSGQH
jgi:hypothetical protein